MQHRHDDGKSDEEGPDRGKVAQAPRRHHAHLQEEEGERTMERLDEEGRHLGDPLPTAQEADDHTPGQEDDGLSCHRLPKRPGPGGRAAGRRPRNDQGDDEGGDLQHGDQGGKEALRWYAEALEKGEAGDEGHR